MSFKGITPFLKPCPANCINIGSSLWLLFDVTHPLISYLPEKEAFFKPSHFATTEFTPSHPINTYSYSWDRDNDIIVWGSMLWLILDIVIKYSVTLVLMTVPSERWRSFVKPNSWISTTFEEHLMVPFGSSLARASTNNCRLRHRTSCFPLHHIWNSINKLIWIFHSHYILVHLMIIISLV